MNAPQKPTSEKNTRPVKRAKPHVGPVDIKALCEEVRQQFPQTLAELAK